MIQLFLSLTSPQKHVRPARRFSETRGVRQVYVGPGRENAALPQARSAEVRQIPVGLPARVAGVSQIAIGVAGRGLRTRPIQEVLLGPPSETRQVLITA